MLLSTASKPFDNADYIYEIKFDGVRAITYLSDQTVILGRSGKDFTPLFPELENLHKHINKKMIIDGEIVCLTNGKPNFSLILSRTASTYHSAKIQSKKYPAILIAFDILYIDDKEIISLPLIERKEILNNTLIPCENLIISECISEKGNALFEFAVKNQLEGIVAKRKKSIYLPGVRSSDWLKIKYIQQENLVICGYITEPNSDDIRYLILGEYNDENQLVYKTKIYIGSKQTDKLKIKTFAKNNTIKKPHFGGFENAIWLKPTLMCKIKYLEKTSENNLRQPIYLGLVTTI